MKLTNIQNSMTSCSSETLIFQFSILWVPCFPVDNSKPVHPDSQTLHEARYLKIFGTVFNSPSGVIRNDCSDIISHVSVNFTSQNFCVLRFIPIESEVNNHKWSDSSVTTRNSTTANCSKTAEMIKIRDAFWPFSRSALIDQINMCTSLKKHSEMWLSTHLNSQCLEKHNRLPLTTQPERYN